MIKSENRRRWVSHAGTASVAAIAAYASYEHMRSLAMTAGQSASIAAVVPLSVDGLVLVCSVALVDGRARRGSAWCGFLLGVAASILANVLAAGPSLVDRGVSAWPSVALLVTIEVIAAGGRRQVARPLALADVVIEPAADVAVADVTTAVSAPTRRARRDSARDRVVAAARRRPGASPAELAAALGLAESTVRGHLRSRPVARAEQGSLMEAMA